MYNLLFFKKMLIILRWRTNHANFQLGVQYLFKYFFYSNWKQTYSLSAREWKVHSFSKGMNFTLTRVKIHFYRMISHQFHSFKSENHSLSSEFFTLFREWSLKSLFLEGTSLNFNKHKRSDHPLKRVKNSLNKSDFHSWKSGEIFTLERVKLVRYSYKSEISLL